MTHVVDPSLRDPHVKIYSAILEAWTDHGRSPSHVELRDATWYSLTTINKIVSDLKKKGYITAPKFQVRSLKPTDLSRTLSAEPLPPWNDLTPPKKWFKVTQRQTHR